MKTPLQALFGILGNTENALAAKPHLPPQPASLLWGGRAMGRTSIELGSAVAHPGEEMLVTVTGCLPKGGYLHRLRWPPVGGHQRNPIVIGM